MKLVKFSKDGHRPQPGVLGEGGVYAIDSAILADPGEPDAMRRLIDSFETLRPALAQLTVDNSAIPHNQVRLHAPLPQPHKLLSPLGNHRISDATEHENVHLFLKGGSALADPGVTVELPNLGGREVFTADAALALVIKGPASKIPSYDWRKVVFGYSCTIDITARTNTLVRFSPGTCIGAACDAFAPLGPVIVTADEVPDPNLLRVRMHNNGETWQDYAVGSMAWSPADLIAAATRMMTLYSGDMIACGGDPFGQGAIQDGDKIEASIDGIGSITVDITDSLNRRHGRDIRLGALISRETSVEILRDRRKIMRENAL